jgi:hypothetical protein
MFGSPLLRQFMGEPVKLADIKPALLPFLFGPLISPETIQIKSAVFDAAGVVWVL